MGVSTDSLQRYLRGEVRPPIDALVRLAEAAGVSVEWLATGRGGQSVRGAMADHAASAEIKGLTLEDVQAIVSIVEGSSVLKDAPLEERARVWMELINSQLKNRARLRAEAAQMLKESSLQSS
jgi:transcriptional regulator with XRE-family HTH domain